MTIAEKLKRTGFMSKPRYDALIVGLGKTGFSCARFLARLGGSFAVLDSRPSPPELDRFREEYPDVRLSLGKFDVELLASSPLLVLSPGISSSEPAIQQAVMNGAEVVGDIELFSRYAKAPVIAVTGSNGKSTVATLVSRMVEAAALRAALGGNIGTPALALLAAEDPDFYVLELSSFQLETVSSLNAAAAAVLNISADHMDRYESLGQYAAVKERIYRGDGWMVINRDDPSVSRMMRTDRNIVCYSLSVPAADEFGLRQERGQEWLCLGERILLPSADLRIKGRHNLSNALAALALGHSAGLPIDAMLTALKEFSGLPHRCERVATSNGVEWINDSKGTNPGATCAAIEGLAGNNDLILIAGGDGKGADFAPLAGSVPGRVRAAVLIGRDAARLAAILESCIAVHYATSMDAAVSTAAKLARDGDKVLLSPACASFDMFRDYQDRGEQFIHAIRMLEQGRI